MKATIKGNKLTIELDLQTPRPSSTGKNDIVCTTSGYTLTAEGLYQGKQVRLSVNGIVNNK